MPGFNRSRLPTGNLRRLHRFAVKALGLSMLMLSGTGSSAAQSLLPAASLEPDNGCDWFKSASNFAYPETHAQYFQAVLPATRPVGSRVRIEGEYYPTRYFSFQLYGPSYEAIDALADYQLQPDPGSRSPLTSETRIDPTVAAGGRFSAFIEFGDKPASPAANTIYAGDAARSGKRVYLYLRAYLSNGVLQLPQLRLETETGSQPFDTAQTSVICRANVLSDRVGSAALANDGLLSPRLIGNLAKLPVRGVPPIANRSTIPFSVYYGLPGGLGGTGVVYNQNAGFMAATIQNGEDLVLIRLRAPSYPKLKGDTVPEVRYWSLCQNRKLNQSVLACVADKQAVIDRDGYAWFLVAKDGSASAALGTHAGFASLPSIGAERAYLIYRQILAREDFVGAVDAVPKDQDPYEALGDYAPLATYCSPALFALNAASDATPAQIFAACNAAP